MKRMKNVHVCTGTSCADHVDAKRVLPLSLSLSLSLSPSLPSSLPLSLPPAQSSQECHMSELNSIKSDLNLAIQNLPKWMSPHNVEKDLLHQFNKAFLLAEPYGTVLIISPWNFPVALCIQPLIGAIAAGGSPMYVHVLYYMCCMCMCICWISLGYWHVRS